MIRLKHWWYGIVGGLAFTVVAAGLLAVVALGAPRWLGILGISCTGVAVALFDAARQLRRR
jgi:hypothetical protein